MFPLIAIAGLFVLILIALVFFFSKKRNNTQTSYQKYLKQFRPTTESQKMPVIYTKIAGTRYKNDDGTERQNFIVQAQVGEPLLLVPQNDNPYDEDAVRVVRLNGQQLGFLDTDLAMEIKSRLTKKIRVEAHIVEISGDAHKEVQISVQRYSRK